jgi:Flp pilus assembly protein TadD
MDIDSSREGAVGGGTFAHDADARTDLGTGAEPSGPSEFGGTGFHEESHASVGAGAAEQPVSVPTGYSPDAPRYDMQKVFARGGMGEVWRATDTSIGRTVALKRMRKQMKGKEDQFFWEGQITGQLEHPGVVPVYELGLDAGGEPYYVMKLLRGKTMLKALEEFHAQPPTWADREVKRLELVQQFLALCQTISYAHSRGIIHRDIKPENVMVGEYGETFVLDWGLAKLAGKDEQAEEIGPITRHSLSGETHETMAGAVKGTPWYMAPETAAGDVKNVDHLSDIYLLGATLYHLLTGKYPRQGKSLPDLITAAHKPPIAPRTHDPSIHKPLEGICQKAMAVDRGARYQSAKELVEDLKHYLAGDPVSAYQETFTERAWRWARKHRKTIGRVAAAIVVLSVLGAGYAQYREMQAESAKRLQEEKDRAKAKEDADAADKALLQAKNEAAERDAAENARKAQEEAAKTKAAADLKKFRGLAEEARFLAANTHPAVARPPFFNPEAGLVKGAAALTVAEPWGQKLDAFPLDHERPGLAQDLYDLLLLMAQVRAQIGGPEAGKDVLARLDRAAVLRPATRSFYRLRGQALAALGKPAEAAEEVKKAADPATPLIAADHFLLGELARVPATRPENLQDRNGMFQADRPAMLAALKEYQLALQADPGHYWANYQLGSCLLSIGRGEEAVPALGACVALRPDVPWGYGARAAALTKIGRFDEAAVDIEKAVKLDPNSRLQKLRRGVLTWVRGDTNNALKDLDEALGPPAERIPEAAVQKALILLNRGQMNDALAAVDLALAGKNPVRTAYRLRAVIHFFQGDDDKGIDDLNSFLAGADDTFNPKSPLAAARRARIVRLIAQDLPAGKNQVEEREMTRIKTRLLTLARTELEYAVEGAGTVDAYEDLGRVQELLGRPTDAIKAYSNALDKVPAGADHNADRVRLLVTRGWVSANQPKPDVAKAGPDFAAALELDPVHAEAHTGMGYIEACKGDGPAARREAQLAVLYRSGDFLILHNVACVFAKLSDTDSANAREFEDLALDNLRRAVELWKRDRSGPNEQAQIQGESAFKRLKKARAKEFAALLAD